SSRASGRHSPRHLICIVAAGAFAGLSLTSLLVVRTRLVDDTLSVVYGPLHLFFGIYFVTGLVYALTLLIHKARALSGAERTHARFVAIAFLLAAFGAPVTNLLLPMAFGISRYGQYAPVFTGVLIGLVGHAIVRHRFMDIRLAVKRGAVYLTSFLVT